MKKRILIIYIFFVCLIVPSVLVIAKNINQAEKPSAIDNAKAERKTRIEQKKKELKEKNINFNSITPRKIEDLLDSKVLTIDDVENLFPEEKLMKLRVSKVFAADKDLTKGLAFLQFAIGEALYEFRYYVGELPSGKMTPKLKSAIKDFQRTLGSDPTGELLFGEFIELTERFDKLHPQRISLPGYSFFDSRKYGSIGYVELKGTWVFKDGTPKGIPIQTSVIELDKNNMQGIEAMASIYYKGDSVVGGLLTPDLIRWKITKWDAEEIVAENDAPAMVSYTMTVDLEGEKVYMYRRPKGKKIIEDLELKPSILELADGFGVSQDFYKKRQEEANKFYNPKYKNMLEQLSETSTKDSIKANRVFAAEEIVFTGIPRIKIFIENGSQGTPEKLSQAKSIEYKCTITKVGNKHYWATRENVELISVQSGIYTTFIAVNGAGYVRFIDPEIKKISFKEGEQPYDYMEHLLLGLSTISYYGTSK